MNLQHQSTNNTKTLAAQLGAILADKQMMITTAESCTGGLLASSITSVSGASKVFNLGLVTYSNQAKIKILKVNKLSTGKGYIPEDKYPFCIEYKDWDNIYGLSYFMNIEKTYGALFSLLYLFRDTTSLLADYKGKQTRLRKVKMKQKPLISHLI